MKQNDISAYLLRSGSSVENREHGFFGPDSIFWKVGRERALFLGGPSAIMLQMAHPMVAEGVNVHSDFATDPVGRFIRTFQVVYAIVFGTVEEAVTAVERTRLIHTRVKGKLSEDAGSFNEGDPYHANRPDLLLWVHATLVAQALLGYDLFVEPLTKAEKEKYYQESKIFAKLFGIPPKKIPPTLSAFYRYYKTMVRKTIAVGEVGMVMKKRLFKHPLYLPVLPLNLLLAGGMLPEPVREAFRFSWNPFMQFAFNRFCRRVRRTLPLLPAQLRYQSEYLKAMKRVRRAGR